MTTIENFKTRRQTILTEALPINVVTDELGNLIPAAQHRAEQLSSLSQEMRRTCWNPEVKASALAIAREADERAAELLGNMRPQSLPRFESFVSGGHIVPAIQ